jgi:hypothetical protein
MATFSAETTFDYIETHVSDNGMVMLPPYVKSLYGHDVVMSIRLNCEQKPKRSFEELCDAWCADPRSTEEIIRDIYDSRTNGRERGPL